MKTVRYLFITMIMAVMCGCTHNNGDIGDFFGTWRLDELTADGQQIVFTDEENLVYTWAFQSHIIFIQAIQPHDNYVRRIGTWEQTDGVLALDFSHSDIDGTDKYTPPAALHLVAGGTTYLEIKKLDKKEMHLQYTANDGVTYAYFLKKAY